MSKNNFNDAVYINAEALELELARFLDKKLHIHKQRF